MWFSSGTAEEFCAALIDIGFEAEPLQTQSCSIRLQLSGLSADAGLSLLADVDGVLAVELCPPPVEAALQIEFDSLTTTARILRDILQDAGAQVQVLRGGPSEESEQDVEVRRWKWKFLGSAIFTVPVFLVAMILPRIPAADDALGESVVEGLSVSAFLLWTLSTPVCGCLSLLAGCVWLSASIYLFVYLCVYLSLLCVCASVYMSVCQSLSQFSVNHQSAAVLYTSHSL